MRLDRVGRRQVIAGLAALPALPALARAQGGKDPSIRRLDPALDAIVDPAASVAVLATGFQWAEGPVWVKDGGYLLFTDPPRNACLKWKAGAGVTPFLQPSGLQTEVPNDIREPGANGLAIDAKGGLIVADSGSRAIVRVDLKTRRRTVLADRFDGKRFNSPNDVVVHPNGTIYFTDPPYGLREGDKSSLKELPINGVYRRTPDGKVELVSDAFARPNGVALSPKRDRLYLALSDEKQPEIMMFPLGADGKPTGEPTRFHDARPQHAEGRPGLPDGLKVDRVGNVFATGPGGVHVVSPQGKLLGIIATGKSIANCAFGEDGRTLFLTSSDMLARVRLKTSGW
jgi:gluconolactonase